MKKRIGLWFYCAAGVFSAFPIGTHAAQLPDAGQTTQELRDRPAIPQESAPSITVERPESNPSVAKNGLKIKVSSFKLNGNRAIGSGELLALLSDKVGKEYDLTGLQAIAERITEYYRSRGFLLARAYLPAQEIKNGIIEIDVIEGLYGTIKLQNHSSVKDGTFAGSLDPLKKGDPVTNLHLDRTLLILADTPGVEIKSTLRPGATVGTSDLIVEVTPGKRVTGSVDADNYGNRFTGQYRLGGTVNIANPADRGDLLTLRGITAGDGLHYARLGYQIPVSGAGTKVGAAYSDMGYKLGQDFVSLNAHGTARIGTVYVLHPFVRSRDDNLYGQLSYDDKQLNDQVDSTLTVSDKKLRNWTVTLNGDVRDDWFGGGAMSASLAYTGGELKINSVAAKAIDSVTARSEGSFGKWGLSLLRLQHMTDALSFYFAYTGQLATKNLDSSEKFYLGGSYGVRAYPQGDAPGDEGHLLNLELRYQVTPAWQMTGFVDAGHTTTNRNPWTTGANSSNLSGGGIGLSWARPGDWVVKASLAWKFGAARPTSDVDRTPRAWVQAVHYF